MGIGSYPDTYWPVGYFLTGSLLTFIAPLSLKNILLLISLNSSASIPGLTYLISLEVLYLLKEKFNEIQANNIAFFSGLIVCFSGINMKSGVVVMSDALGLLFICLSVLFMLKFINSYKPVFLFISFVCFSYSVMIRYAAVLMLPMILFLLVIAFSRAGNKKRLVYLTLFSLIAGALVFTPQLITILGKGISYLNYDISAGTWAGSWSIFNFFKSSFVTADGSMHYRLPNALFCLTPVFHPLYMSLSGIFIVAASVMLIKKRDVRIIMFICVWILPAWVYLSGVPFQSLRYTYIFLPVLSFIASYGLVNLRISKLFKNILLGLLLCLMVVYNTNHIIRFNEQKYKDLQVVEWINSNISTVSITPQLIYTFEITGAVNYYTKIHAAEFFNAGINEIKSSIDTCNCSVYFILPAEKLSTQWKGLPVEEKFNSLVTAYKPEVITRISYYTIYKINKIK
jgi:hypothetical protein